jgi:hypothetical protein
MLNFASRSRGLIGKSPSTGLRLRFCYYRTYRWPPQVATGRAGSIRTRRQAAAGNDPHQVSRLRHLLQRSMGFRDVGAARCR